MTESSASKSTSQEQEIKKKSHMTTIFNVIRPQAMPTKIHNQWYGLQTLNQTLQTKLTDSHKPASTQFFPYNDHVDFTSLPRFHPTQILPPPRLLSQPSHHTLTSFGSLGSQIYFLSPLNLIWYGCLGIKWVSFGI